MTLSLLASASVLAGELINSFLLPVARYSQDFIFWIPGTGIPLFIIFGGALLSVISFLAAQIVPRTFSMGSSLAAKIVCLLFFSLSSMILECIGIDYGFWSWNIPHERNFWWFLGVWKFYACFVFMPAFVALLIFGKK